VDLSVSRNRGDKRYSFQGGLVRTRTVSITIYFQYGFFSPRSIVENTCQEVVTVVCMNDMDFVDSQLRPRAVQVETDPSQLMLYEILLTPFCRVILLISIFPI